MRVHNFEKTREKTRGNVKFPLFCILFRVLDLKKLFRSEMS